MNEEAVLSSLASYVGMLSDTLVGTTSQKNEAIIKSFSKTIDNLLSVETVDKDKAIKPLLKTVCSYLEERANLFKEASGQDNEQYLTAIAVLTVLARDK